MKRLFPQFAFPIVIVLRQTSLAAEPGSESDQMNAATKVLDAWHNDQLEPAERFLHIVCWTLIKGWNCAARVPACQ